MNLEYNINLFSLVITFNYKWKDYKLVYTQEFVTSKDFTIEKAKEKIDFIIFRTRHERTKVANFIVHNVYQYQKTLKDAENKIKTRNKF